MFGTCIWLRILITVNRGHAPKSRTCVTWNVTLTSRPLPEIISGVFLSPSSSFLPSHFLFPFLSFSSLPFPLHKTEREREFPGISEILAGITGNFAEFCLFFQFLLLIMTFFVFNLTAFWAKTLNDVFTQLFVFIEFRYTFKYWYRKIIEQRQNFANSDRYTNEDAEIILIGHRPSFCIHRRGMKGVLRKMF